MYFVIFQAEALATELDEQNRALAQQQMEEDARRKAELARADTEAQVRLLFRLMCLSGRTLLLIRQ